MSNGEEPYGSLSLARKALWAADYESAKTYFERVSESKAQLDPSLAYDVRFSLAVLYHLLKEEVNDQNTFEQVKNSLARVREIKRQTKKTLERYKELPPASVKARFKQEKMWQNPDATLSLFISPNTETMTLRVLREHAELMQIPQVYTSGSIRYTLDQEPFTYVARGYSENRFDLDRLRNQSEVSSLEFSPLSAVFAFADGTGNVLVSAEGMLYLEQAPRPDDEELLHSIHYNMKRLSIIL